MSEQDTSRRHDETYRSVFGHPSMLRALLEGFVESTILAELDLEQMQQTNTKFSFKGLSVREPDVIWEVQRRDPSASPVYVLIMLEFQSKVDWTMPVRIMQYASLAYEQTIKQRGGPSTHTLPATLPIVLYNGKRRWRAPTSLRQMMRLPANTPLSKYSPALEFLLVDVSSIDPAHLDQLNNICAMMLRLEQLDTTDDLAKYGTSFVDTLRAILPEPLREDLAIWFAELLRSIHLPIPIHTILQDKENSPMLADSMRKFRKKMRREGRKEGILYGQRETLAKLLQLRFGADEGRGAWIKGLDSAQLDLLAERLLSAAAEPELRAEIEAQVAE